jgi:hypothetical protein
VGAYKVVDGQDSVCVVNQEDRFVSVSVSLLLT